MASTRTLLGIMVLVMIAGAALAWWQGSPQAAGVLIRVALIGGAVWLAWPSLSAVPRRAWGIATVAVALVLWRPKSAWLVVPVLLLVAGRRRVR